MKAGLVQVCLQRGVAEAVHQSVQLIHHNVYVVASDTRRQHGEALPLVATCDGVKLSAGDVAFDTIELGGHHGYTPRVTHKDYL